jgi:hypothetical protein
MVLPFIPSYSPQSKSSKFTEVLDILVPLRCHNFWLGGLTNGRKQMPEPGEIALKLGHWRFGAV